MLYGGRIARALQSWCSILLNWARIGLSAFEDGEPVSLDKAVEMGRMIASIEPAKEQGAPEGNQNAKKGVGNKVANSHIDSEKKRSKASANLKRYEDELSKLELLINQRLNK